jgi:hypothetical protein
VWGGEGWKRGGGRVWVVGGGGGGGFGMVGEGKREGGEPLLIALQQ